ncbi:MAG TPA: diguanylate cyclase [Vicinamibacterales bacterium]|jgi:diguanylate cyclase (GGDEF)-like protein|nr:diguanylate cyclase [Vicinamibacterales bacterium]
MQLTHGHPSTRLVTESPRLPTTWAAVATIAALFGILALDASTASAPVQHLYYLPIVFAGVTFGWRGGVACAFVAIVFYHLANWHPLTWHNEEPDVLQMMVFIAAGLLSARLADDARRLRRMALTDDLTGLHNLRSFEERLRVLVADACVSGKPLSLLVLDVDRLKSLNDVHGHLAGAEAVRLVGRILADRLPSNAVACRYGGDEFVVALPESDASEASAVAERVARHVNEAAPLLAGVQHPATTLSISVGVVSHVFDRTTRRLVESIDALGEQLFHAADTALYAAKNGGRNRISVTPSLRHSPQRRENRSL